MKVASAFGGLVIYKAEAVRGLRYFSRENKDEKIQSECEHWSFHAGMSEKGCDRIFINPSLILYHNTWRSIIKKLIYKFLRNLY